MSLTSDMQSAAAAFVADPTVENEAAVRSTSKAYGLAARLVDERVEGLRRTARKLTTAAPCTRCGGSGEYQQYGVCFRCDGSGREPQTA